MQYHPQSENACLAYALWQIGAVDGDAVKEYEQAISSGLDWKPVGQWMQSYVPKYWEALTPIRTFSGPPGSIPVLDSVPSFGKGVLYLQLYDALNPLNVGWHAVSYEDGRLLDPHETGPGTPETWDEFKARYLKSLLSPVIIHAAEAV